jgi:oxygen-dependent protoporphyrinogen oxidase
VKILIIGGGISGLSAAYHLQKTKASAQIYLIEKEKRLGGKIETLHQDGYIIETGPESLVSYKPAAINLCQELGLSSEIIPSIPENRKTFFFLKGNLIPFPEGIFSAFQAPFFRTVKTLAQTPLLSPLGKLRIGLEPFIPPRQEDDDEAAGSFFSRRLGREFFNHLIAPFLSGIYGGDTENLSMKSVLPTFYAAEKKYGSLLKAILANKNKKSSSQQIPPFVSLKNGLGSLIDKLVKSLQKNRIDLGKSVVAVKNLPGGYQVLLENGERVESEILIIATPVQKTADILKDLDPEASKLLSEIPSSSASVVTLGFDQNDLSTLSNSYGFLISPEEKFPFLACTMSSNKWEGRAPEGKFIMRFYANTILDDPEKSTNEFLKQLPFFSKIKKKPELFLVHSHPNVMPEYRVSHEKKMEQIQRALTRHPGLFLAGNAYQGIGISDCILSGVKAAEKAVTT